VGLLGGAADRFCPDGRFCMGGWHLAALRGPNRPRAAAAHFNHSRPRSGEVTGFGSFWGGCDFAACHRSMRSASRASIWRCLGHPFAAFIVRPCGVQIPLQAEMIPRLALQRIAALFASGHPCAAVRCAVGNVISGRAFHFTMICTHLRGCMRI